MKYYKTNKILSIILCLFICLGTAEALAQDQTQAQAISMFQKKIDKFNKFFSSKPILLVKQSLKEEDSSKDDLFSLAGVPTAESPTGFIFFYQRFELHNISNEIRKSTSVASPYTGYIFVHCGQSESRKCGDFEIDGKRYFTTIELARKQRDHHSCYETSMERGKELIFSYTFIFTFQNKKWEFKDVLLKMGDDIPDPILWTAFGKPSRGNLYVKDNDFWKELIE